MKHGEKKPTNCFQKEKEKVQLLLHEIVPIQSKVLMDSFT